VNFVHNTVTKNNNLLLLREEKLFKRKEYQPQEILVIDNSKEKIGGE